MKKWSKLVSGESPRWLNEVSGRPKWYPGSQRVYIQHIVWRVSVSLGRFWFWRWTGTRRTRRVLVWPSFVGSRSGCSTSVTASNSPSLKRRPGWAMSNEQWWWRGQRWLVTAMITTIMIMIQWQRLWYQKWRLWWQWWNQRWWLRCWWSKEGSQSGDQITIDDWWWSIPNGGSDQLSIVMTTND